MDEQKNVENGFWIKITAEEVATIREKGLTWASDIILSRFGLENTHYIGDYDLQTCTVALNRNMMDDEAEFRRLNRQRMKAYRDKKRTRKYLPRPKQLKP